MKAIRIFSFVEFIAQTLLILSFFIRLQFDFLKMLACDLRYFTIYFTIANPIHFLSQVFSKKHDKISSFKCIFNTLMKFCFLCYSSITYYYRFYSILLSTNSWICLSLLLSKGMKFFAALS